MTRHLLLAALLLGTPVAAQTITLAEGTMTSLSIVSLPESNPNAAGTVVLQDIELLPVEITGRYVGQEADASRSRRVTRNGMVLVALPSPVTPLVNVMDRTVVATPIPVVRPPVAGVVKTMSVVFADAGAASPTQLVPVVQRLLGVPTPSQLNVAADTVAGIRREEISKGTPAPRMERPLVIE